MRRAYLAKLDALEAEVKDAIATIPADNRRIITSHDAFGYFGAAYGLTFLAPEGISTEAEPPPDVAKLIDADQEAEDPGRLHGEHHRSAADRADRQGERREDRRQLYSPTRCRDRQARRRPIST